MSAELDMVRLVSQEGHEFVVDKKAAMVSGTIKAMLSSDGMITRRYESNEIIGAFMESGGEIKFQDISTPILEKVIQYFYFKLKYNNATMEIPEFTIDPEIALELLMAANFLDT